MKANSKFLVSVTALLLASATLLTGCMLVMAEDTTDDVKPYSGTIQKAPPEELEPISTFPYGQKRADEQSKLGSDYEFNWEYWKKFSSMMEFDEETDTVTVFPENYLENYWKSNYETEVIHSLTAEEFVFLLEDTVQLCSEYETIVLPGFAPDSDDPDVLSRIPTLEGFSVSMTSTWGIKFYEDIYRINDVFKYRLRAFSSPASFSNEKFEDVHGLCPSYYIPGYTKDSGIPVVSKDNSGDYTSQLGTTHIPKNFDGYYVWRKIVSDYAGNNSSEKTRVLLDNMCINAFSGSQTFRLFRGYDSGLESLIKTAGADVYIDQYPITAEEIEEIIGVHTYKGGVFEDPSPSYKPDPALAEKFSSMISIDRSTSTVTVMSQDAFDAYWKDVTKDDRRGLTFEELLYLIEDTVQLYYNYDNFVLPALSANISDPALAARIPTLDGDIVISPSKDEISKGDISLVVQVSRILRIVRYRVAAFSSPDAFINSADNTYEREIYYSPDGQIIGIEPYHTGEGEYYYEREYYLVDFSEETDRAHYLKAFNDHEKTPCSGCRENGQYVNDDHRNGWPALDGHSHTAKCVVDAMVSFLPFEDNVVNFYFPE